MITELMSLKKDLTRQVPKFRKRPVTIEAHQYFMGKELETPGVCTNEECFPPNMGPHVHTMHNNQCCELEPGDWVVPEPDGVHYYPVKPDVFDSTYELVT